MFFGFGRYLLGLATASAIISGSSASRTEDETRRPSKHHNLPELTSMGIFSNYPANHKGKSGNGYRGLMSGKKSKSGTKSAKCRKGYKEVEVSFSSFNNLENYIKYVTIGSIEPPEYPLGYVFWSKDEFMGPSTEKYDVVATIQVEFYFQSEDADPVQTGVRHFNFYDKHDKSWKGGWTEEVVEPSIPLVIITGGGGIFTGAYVLESSDEEIGQIDGGLFAPFGVNIICVSKNASAPGFPFGVDE